MNAIDLAAEPVNVVHEPEKLRFVAHFPEGEGELTYRRIAPHTLDLVHTGVDPALQGRGIAGALARAAFAHARRENLKVLPTCPFLQHWLAKHPEERDLITTRVAAS
jgi:predicted GNAT family acetyltransferase